MSYDLFLTTATDIGAVRGWLRSRGYSVTESEAVHDNKATGVSFGLHLTGLDDGTRLAFHLNYFRPDFFALEAEPHVAELIAELDAALDDPQANGMADGPYTRDGFLAGWRHGNRFAASVVAAQAGPAMSLSRDTNTAVWQWNNSRTAYLDLLGRIEMVAAFVPLVMLFVVDGQPQTGVVWGERMALVVPTVDWIIALDKPGDPPRWQPWSRVAPALTGYPTRADHKFSMMDGTYESGLRHYVVEEPNEAVVQMLSHPGETVEIEGRLHPALVVDTELLSEG
jgi:hypothetical protein